MLTTARELNEIQGSLDWIGDDQRRMVAFARSVEAAVLLRLRARLQSAECYGLTRDQIVSWLDSLLYDKSGERSSALPVRSLG
jgi:hypothetical protein